jgi:hypothetical protein
MTSLVRSGRPSLLLILAAALALGGCAAGYRTGADPFAAGSSAGEYSASGRRLRIEVQNNNFNDARVEARGIGRQRRLGRVQGTGSEVFTMDWTVSAPIYFEIDLLGGERCVTRSIEVAGGQTVRLTIDSMARIRADGLSRLCDAKRVR